MVDAKGGIGASAWLDSAEVQVPRYLRLDDEFLAWSWQVPRTADVGPRRRSTKGMLDAFLSINDAKGILRFARRYGVIDLCEHGVPAWHMGECYLLGEHVKPPPDFDTRLRREPISRWLHYVRDARALLLVSAALRQGRTPSEEQWYGVSDDHEPLGDPLPTYKGGNLLGDRLELVVQVETWLKHGGVRLSFQWNRPSMGLSLKSVGTFGRLATQLLTAISGSQGVPVCSECGHPYVAKRKPQAGRRNYCRDCGERAASRNRKRKSRMPKEDQHE